MNELDYLLSPVAIRERSRKILDLTKEGRGKFIYHEEKLAPTVDFVLQTIKENYPDENIPFHSRWGHFRAGKINRLAALEEQIHHFDPIERARIKFDLVIPSVLLDAGAGAQWNYLEKDKKFNRSEGLGVASWHMFLSGVFANDRNSLRTDGEALIKLKQTDIEQHFQVSAQNPLVGVAGRLQLMQNLGTALLQNKKIFKEARPGYLVDYLIANGREIKAASILRAVLDAFGGIWPGRLTWQAQNLGDVWSHPALGQAGSFESLVPFHKLSQWMTYSLIEPLQEAGIKVLDPQELTGLAEYRNGGLFVDSGLITLRDPIEIQKSWKPDSTLVVEWRALTVSLLDDVARGVCQTLGKNWPLGKILEGGTWWAGRKWAARLRADSSPPIQIESDGTVF